MPAVIFRAALFMNSTPLNRRQFLRLLPPVAAGVGGVSCSPAARVTADGRAIVRFGHFPNVTHVQALVAHQWWRRGQCWFKQRCGVEIEWFIYNAGPSVMEAFFTRALDLSYIGPSPVLNAYAKSAGAEPRILAGAANGGSALVVRPASGITQASDFRGKRVGTPQLGNTQDVQLRAWLKDQGFTITQTGGDVLVIPTSNADQLGLFAKGSLDAVWTAEPWATRLELESAGRVFLEDRESPVTLLVGRTAWLAADAELASAITAAHVELTQWITEHPEEARKMIKAELKSLTTSAPSDAVLDGALARTVLTTKVSLDSLQKMVTSAQKAGFLKSIPPLEPLLAGAAG